MKILKVERKKINILEKQTKSLKDKELKSLPMT